MSAAEKGYANEELLRRYFLDAGYFAVRGAPFSFGSEDVTDIDIWLYSRTSAFARHTAIVDAKFKARPKALERVLWARGLKEILGVDTAIVATTDRRPIVREFGRLHDVPVLDGQFQALLRDRDTTGEPRRYTEEELKEVIVGGRNDKLNGAWGTRLAGARSRLLTSLGFDGCNGWLEDVRFFLEAGAVDGQPEGAFRAAYIVTAYLLIGLDYSMSEHAFRTADARRSAMEDGFRFGDEGADRAISLLRALELLSTQAFQDGGRAGKSMRDTAIAEFEALPVEILGEFFTRRDIGRSLFALARDFERAAYARDFVPPNELALLPKSTIGVLCDYHKLDRRHVLGTRSHGDGETSSG